MLLRLVLAVAAVLLITPVGANASVADEERQGRDLVARLQAGDKRCDDLAAQDFEVIGEYVMGRMVGSTEAHEAMNERMREVMGERAEQRMHELMGRRYAGCATGSGGAGTQMGPGMMGSDRGSGMMGDHWGSMMDSEDWGWMAGGAWRTMGRQDWQSLQDRWMGPGMMRAGDGWSAWAIVGVVLAAVAATALLVVLLTRRSSQHRAAGAH